MTNTLLFHHGGESTAGASLSGFSLLSMARLLSRLSLRLLSFFPSDAWGMKGLRALKGSGLLGATVIQSVRLYGRRSREKKTQTNVSVCRKRLKRQNKASTDRRMQVKEKVGQRYANVSHRSESTTFFFFSFFLLSSAGE